MPSWQPNWNDVHFDHAAARAAVDELRRCASLLESQTHERVRLATVAQQAWRGRARDRFDEELARMRSQAADLVERLRATARRIEAAADEARVEQARREASRQRWYDERRLEQVDPTRVTPRRPMPV